MSRRRTHHPVLQKGAHRSRPSDSLHRLTCRPCQSLHDTVLIMLNMSNEFVNHESNSFKCAGRFHRLVPVLDDACPRGSMTLPSRDRIKSVASH